ncbi:aminoglycoside phosphotransferase [Actinobacteria bacterium OK074]|nr:aminoglycoside phosphotransferase [Actinobacteria bacterium OK074]
MPVVPVTDNARKRARRALEAAGLSGADLVECRPLGGGTYNTVDELLLADGTRYVLKTEPPATAPALTYERELLVGEAEFCRAAATAGVPAPHVVGPGPANGGLLLTFCPGTAAWDDLPPAEHALLRRELGAQVARLHRVAGPGFGYPAGALAADWRTAFAAMYGAILADARHFGARLPRPVADIARTAAAAYDALDEVTQARLVHFDLWPGNILVDRTGEGPRIGGLIDGERMFWGDPLADFVSLALLADIRQDEDFLTGYQEAGGNTEFGPAAVRRLALYRSYLYLIMIVETIPRGMSDDHVAWVQDAVVPQLEAALDGLMA